MRVEVSLFARFRDHAGCDRVTFELPGPMTISSLRQSMFDRWPELEQLLRSSLFAVGTEYVTDDHLIAANDVIALIPPVSGGMK